MKTMQMEAGFRQNAVAEVIAIETHAGNASYTGGEYGFCTYYTMMEDGTIVESHHTSAAFNYCPHYGSFQDCEPDHVYRVYESLDELKLYEPEIAHLMEHGGGVMDCTGHEPICCLHGCGCILCYPCNHHDCLERLETLVKGTSEGDEEDTTINDICEPTIRLLSEEEYSTSDRRTSIRVLEFAVGEDSEPVKIALEYYGGDPIAVGHSILWTNLRRGEEQELYVDKYTTLYNDGHRLLLRTTRSGEVAEYEICELD